MPSQERKKSISVTFDKSHIITIGEKLYGESLELIRELVSNAYDADATRVWIEIEKDRLRIRDDGSGMDEAGLREFFNIGSQNKKFSNTSPIYKRPRVGQFGIGKFAVLTACEVFRVTTQKNGFSAEVQFDKKHWFESEHWTLPIEEIPFNHISGNGTTITLERLKKNFQGSEIERFIRERLPLTAPHFSIFINNRQIEPIYIAGKKFPISVHTLFGRVSGEIIVPNFPLKKEEKPGIECIVKGVVVMREFFGFDPQYFQKIWGKVTADFLPITSDRSRFITDSPEYEAFYSTVRKELKKIMGNIREIALIKENQKADDSLKDAMHRLGKAIRKNPDIAPQVMSPSGEIDETGETPNAERFAPESESGEEGIDAIKLNFGENIEEKEPFENDPENPSDQKTQKKEEVKKVKIKNLTGKMMVARRIKIGEFGVVCTLEPCGKESPPAFTEGGIIYINQDHPLYKKQNTKGKENISFYLAYLISQQVSLMFVENDPRKAFDVQNRLLADSF